MKPILCTGGLGYIGSHTIVSLVEKGYLPIILDNETNSTSKCLNRLQELTHQNILYYHCDLNKLNDTSNVFQSVEEKQGSPIYGVIHFAALKAVGDSVKNPLEYY